MAEIPDEETVQSLQKAHIVKVYDTPVRSFSLAIAELLWEAASVGIVNIKHCLKSEIEAALTGSGGVK